MVLLEKRLRIESVHVRNPAAHEQPNDPLGFRSELGNGTCAGTVGENFLIQQTAQGNYSKAGTGTEQGFTAAQTRNVLYSIAEWCHSTCKNSLAQRSTWYSVHGLSVCLRYAKAHFDSLSEGERVYKA